ncbi:MAG: M48 family metalloprotease [Pseudomonadota bacterium]|nr:M48 family metalloprotease [Pseudomonadota bacterium]
MRPNLPATLLSIALGVTCATGGAVAQDSRLPDIGSSAGTLLSPAQEAEYGAMTLSQLRNYGYTLDDPLIAAWLQSMGARLGAASDNPTQRFTFFLLGDRQINAFATLGGYIGVNAGLVLAADREDEVAAVLAHEVAHVTQEHVLRGVEAAQRDSIPILLAMLGAIAIAQGSGGNSADDATMAALMSAQGLMAQRQIDYTRSNEAEADRVGIRTLARGGYDPDAMAGFFEQLQSVVRSTETRESAPDYLRTHPVTTTRISEARDRARQLADAPQPFVPSGRASDNPMLPASLRIATTPGEGIGGNFSWARERLRVLSANSPAQAVREYERIGKYNALDDAQRYGLALAHYLDGNPARAIDELTALLRDHPGQPWLELATAQAEARAGRIEAADARFEALVARMPSSRAVALTYAATLNERNTPAAGQRAQALLRPLLAGAADDPVFQRTFARTSEIAGDPVRAGEAYAEAAFLNGRAEQALVQLNTLKKRDDLDYYARARIDARIAAITPVVLELRRQGIRDPDLDRR